MRKQYLLIVVGIASFCLGLKPANSVKSNDLEPASDHYKLHELPLTTNSAQGWLLEFLKRQRTGLTGHPEVLSYPFNSCLWAGNITRDGETHGENWWRYEQTAYYTDGLLRLGYLLQDSSLIRKGREGIYYTIARQTSSGYMGPQATTSLWPMAVFFRAMEAEYMATRNPRIIDALQRYYLSFTPQELGDHKRNIVNIEGALWVYGLTRNKQLLDLSEKAYAEGGFELNMEKCNTDSVTITHGVTYMEMAKLPAILFAYTGKQQYLDAAVNAMRKLDRDHMLPDGVPSSNEFLSGKDPMHSHETCDITDYTWAAGYLLMATGDVTWADHIERAVFNAGPGAISKDFKNLQYFSSVNQVIATGISNHNSYKHGTTWMAYWPCHETECCAGNVHRFMPNYIARMWMRNEWGGPTAALYGPCVQKFPLPNGRDSITINESTGYPFDEKITFAFSAPISVNLPFSLRIPAWCSMASLTINGKPYQGKFTPGTFVTINRQFKTGDKIVLNLPMAVRLLTTDWGTSVQRGPLLYAYAVLEMVKADTATYPKLNGKKSYNPDFPALDIRPAGAWNYALHLNSRNLKNSIKVIKTGKSAYPLDPGQSPVVIRVPAYQLPGWRLAEDRYTPDLPKPGELKANPATQFITLVPYGSTRLRVSVFPTAAF